MRTFRCKTDFTFQAQHIDDALFKAGMIILKAYAELDLEHEAVKSEYFYHEGQIDVSSESEPEL